MDFEIADIEVNPGAEDQVRLAAVPFHFNPGERSLYTGADNTGGIVQRAGWLGLQVDAFKGWQSVDVISVTGSQGTDAVFEVKRNFNTPMQEGEWLWFPAMPQKVEEYRD
ncbi:hypothetical protein [Pseudomonas sp. URMO17WK12:I12]|uniref:hypothetical protein n=1 Tax=Pseudomonas sp. URMO17WK12:I12 TaxID=1259797 RepID=UPI000483C835|nr:hypothetical protein [Pseudomonas sp. URMO17WK12:I12]